MLSFVLKTAAFTALLFLIVTHSQTTSAEWEDVPAEQKRLESQKTAVPEKTEVIDKSVYKVGEGIIEGAFGIDFDVSLDASITIKDLGWIPMFTLPDGLSYTGLIQPFDLRCLSVKPPSVPALINKANISYKVCLDFSSNPLWIHADNVRDTDRVIEILKRKYGEPEIESDTQVRFDRGDYRLNITRNGDRCALDYYAMQSFADYLGYRNKRLRKKYKEDNRQFLNEKELRIVMLADQFADLRQSFDQVFGINFAKRVGFIASPDTFTEFIAPKPMFGLGKGIYKVMVSPELTPIKLQFGLKGSRIYLMGQKTILDHALELAFGGFLKRTDIHSVLTWRGNSLSVLIRDDTLKLTVIDGQENRKYNQRVKDTAIAKHKTKVEAQRLLDLQNRKKEIAVEEGF